MAFIVKGLTTSAAGQPVLPPSAKTDLSTDIITPGSTVRGALDATIAKATRTLFSNGSADQTTRINTELSAAAGGALRLVGSFTISAPLNIQSNTTLDVSEATITLAAGSNCMMLRNRAQYTSQRTVTGVATTAGSKDITAAGFTSADVGRSVVIPDAGGTSSPGVRAPHTGVVTAVVGDVVTLSISAPATTTGKTATVYDRDRNIRIVGSGHLSWNRGANEGSGSNLHTLVFRRVDGLYIDQPGVSSTGGKYAISVGDIRTGWVHDAVFNSASDGVHALGPMKTFTTRGVRGFTHDDSVAYGMGDYITYADVSGPIEDCHIEDVDTISEKVLAKIFTCDHYRASGCTIKKIRGSGPTSAVAVGDATGWGGIDVMIIDDVSAFTGANSELVQIEGNGHRHIIIRNLAIKTVTANAVALRSQANVDTLTIEGVTTPASYTGRVVHVQTGTTIRSLRCRGGVVHAASSGRSFNLTATVNEMVVTDWEHTGGNALVYMNTNTATMGMKFSDVRLGSAKLFEHVAPCAVTVYMQSVSGVASPAMFDVQNASAVLTVLANPETVNLAGSKFTRNGAQPIRMVGVQVDVGQMANAVNGDRLYNVNASRSCGAGWVSFMGGVWTHTITGATYTVPV